MAEPLVSQQIRDKVRKEWTAESTAAAWRKWHPKLMHQTQQATEAIGRAARVEPGMELLDVACGSGEPSLTLAERVAPVGRVTATDFSSGMLAVAEENAPQRGVKNIAFRLADAEALPFPDETFDRVTCRFGVMFFPDVGKALADFLRVLRPRGRAALLAWGALEQPFFALTAGVIQRHVKPPPPPPGAPAPDRFAQPGTLKQALERAGFREVAEEHRTLRGVWPGPPEEGWEAFSEIAAPFRAMTESLEAAERAQLVGEVVRGLRGYYNGTVVDLPLLVVLGTGIR